MTHSFLPTQPTPLVDRTHELAEIIERLVGGDTRLLTLTGSAGVGKTRLALAAAVELTDHFREVMFVDLSPVRDPELVLSTILGSVGFPNLDIGSQSPLEQLQDALEQRQMLLVLDNFEQVLPAGAVLAELLAASANLRLLVTSRAPLRLRWERTLRIAPLPVPDLDRPLPPLDELTTIPSIELFLQQVRARQANFVLTEKQAPLVARLMSQLDGMPLALELAAARTATLTLPAMAHRPSDRLRLLHWEASDVPERQRSLEAAIGWSYDLLSEPERRFFRCLGVFVQRVALDAFTAVCSNVVSEAYAGGGVCTLDKLHSLAEQSLIQPAPPAVPGWQDERSDDDDADVGEDPAFGMLETVREYAEDRLAAAGELETARRAHAAYFLALVERAESQLRGPGQHRWLLRLERERENLRAALRWLLDQDTPEDRAAALRLAGALGSFWQLGGYHAEGRRWLEEALSRAPQGQQENGADSAARMRALLPAGMLCACFGELDRSRAFLEEALALARQLQDSAGIMQALIFLGASPIFARQAPALPLLKSALGKARALGDPDRVGIALYHLGLALRAQGHDGAAAAHFTEALDQFEVAGDARAAGDVRIQLGALLGLQGDWTGALRHLRSGLTTSVSLRSRWLLSQGAWAVLAVLGDRADPGARARLLGSADALRQAIGVGCAAREHMAAHPGEPGLRERSGQEEWAAAYRRGRALPVGEAAALALRMLDEFAQTLPLSAPASIEADMSRHPGRVRAARQDGESRGGHLLTEREREVLRLVEQGLSNKVIGRQMFISDRTISQHLTSVFNKLSVNTRAQAVALALHRGLI
ncbi:MAG: LuxR C-terminal-related transcriptional regulator [Dehalococcoidia bacterium]